MGKTVKQKKTTRESALKTLLSISLENIPADEMLERIIDCLTSLPGLAFTSIGGIWLADGKGGFCLKAHKGFSSEIRSRCGTFTEDSCCRGSAVGAGELTYYNCADPDQRCGMGPHGHYSMPVIYEGKTLAFISLYVEKDHKLDKRDEGFLRSIADIIASMLERKRMEEALKSRLVMERALSEVSQLFVTEEEVDLNKVLSVLGGAVNADRVYIFRISGDGGKMDNTHEWCAPGVEPFINKLKKIDTSVFRWMLGKLLAGENVNIPDASVMPPVASAEKEEFSRRSTKAILLVPISSKKEAVKDFIGFDDTKGARVWSEDDANILRVAGELISNYFERKEAEETIRRMAYYDFLTGLPNRRLLLDRLEQVLAGNRWKKRLAAVIFLDIDRFKNVNDTFGHAMGDELLKAIGYRLRERIHDADTVSRIGGDEFTIILNEINRPEDIALIVKKIYSAFEWPISLGGQEIYVSASTGVSIFPIDGEHARELIDKADIAMYRAKKEGRGCYRVYNPVMNEKAAERLSIENMLRKAVKNRELFLEYQPQMDMSTGETVGFEALVRWRNEGQSIPPSEFIPIAEEAGLILELGEFVLKSACMKLERIRKAGFDSITMAVNISSRQFKSAGFAEKALRIVNESGADPRSIEMELTESIIMDNTEEVINIMKGLKGKGIRFSIDDFGTGYSSLSYLKRLPIDSLKIDRSFIMNLKTNSDEASIVIAIIRLAHSLKLKVIAEGVEEEGQLKFLKLLECDVIQGYLYSGPLPSEKVLDFLKKGKRLK